MTCPVCTYWNWRLADLQISLKKAQEANTGDYVIDVARVLRAQQKHQESHR